jgi:5'-phosphate synthase pdxT subunit
LERGQAPLSCLGKKMNIGVLALQGAFIEHVQTLRRLGVEAVEVRTVHELRGVDGLVIPGGESTAMLKLARHYHLIKPLQQMVKEGKPIMGTCAGMILLASKITESDMQTLCLMDIEVRRNAFGRQVDSFETDLAVPALGDEPFHAVFIRAPYIERLGNGVEALARLEDGTVVAVRQKNLLALAFHPELGHDTRLHEYFLGMVKESLGSRKK